MTVPAGSLVLGDGLVLCAPGGVFVPDARALVVADLHVGYAATLRARGYSVPAGDDEALYARLMPLLESTRAERLVVAGDLVHGPGSVRGEPSALAVFVDRLRARGCELVTVLGNHDARVATHLDRLGAGPCEQTRVGAHVVQHGDDVTASRMERANARARGGRVLLGHLHPALMLSAGAGAREKRPAFVSAPGVVFLPAFSPFARGGDVRSAEMRAQLRAFLDAEDPTGIAVCVAGNVVPVGDALRSRSRSQRVTSKRTQREAHEEPRAVVRERGR